MVSGALGAMILLSRRKKALAVVVLAISGLLTSQIGLTGHNEAARDRSAKHVAEAIRDNVKPDVPFYSVMGYDWTLAFYLKRHFILVQYQDEMSFGIQQEPERWVPTIEGLSKIWATQTEAFAVMPAAVFPRLQKLGMSMKIIYEDSQHIVVSRL